MITDTWKSSKKPSGKQSPISIKPRGTEKREKQAEKEDKTQKESNQTHKKVPKAPFLVGKIPAVSKSQINNTGKKYFASKELSFIIKPKGGNIP